MKKRLFSQFYLILMILVFISASLFLTSCSGNVAGGQGPLDTATALRIVSTGTQGVDTALLPNNPPSLIYDHNELNAIVEVKNHGNYPLQPEDCLVQVTGFDPNIITGGFNFQHSCAENMDQLEGKTIYNTEGGFNQIEFYSPQVILPQGVYEYNPSLNFLTCYKYHTTTSPSVCVDPLFYQVTSEQKTCLPTNVGLGGGQGGPVGVTYVGVQMTGEKAIFEINVMNLGSGRVLSPYADLRGCGQATLERSDFDHVAYTVKMSGGSLIDCKPRDGFVPLYNNQGKIICSFSVPGTTSFQTPLIIDLDYGYMQSFQSSIKIVQQPR